MKRREYDVTRAAEYLRWNDHGKMTQLFGKPYVWVIEGGRLRLVRPGSLPQIKMTERPQ